MCLVIFYFIGGFSAFCGLLALIAGGAGGDENAAGVGCYLLVFGGAVIGLAALINWLIGLFG